MWYGPSAVSVKDPDHVVIRGLTVVRAAAVARLPTNAGKKSELTSDMLSGIEFQMRRSGIAVSDHTYLGGDTLAHSVGMAYHTHLLAS